VGLYELLMVFIHPAQVPVDPAAAFGEAGTAPRDGPRPTNWAWRNIADHDVRGRRCPVMTTDRIIKWSTALLVLGAAAVTAVASYQHAYDLVWAHGESGWTARMVQLTVDGLIYAQFDGDARLGAPKGTRSRAGAVAARPGHRGDALAANVAHGLGDRLSGAAVAACPAVADMPGPLAPGRRHRAARPAQADRAGRRDAPSP
jgi:hypothetical protein